jgi:hypothetical protein
VREQAGRTRASFSRLVGAHVDLAKAEMGEIADEIKVIAILGGILFGLALLLVDLLFVGTWLFVGEWLFGSLGWGLLHGTLATVGVMTAVGLALVGATMRPALLGFVVAVVVTIVLSLLFASNVLRNTSEYVASQLALSVTIVDPVAVPGALAGGILLGLLLLIVGWRGGGTRTGVVGLVAGFVLGVILGAVLGGWRWQTHTAIAFSIAVGLMIWMIAAVALALREGIDPAKRFSRLKPSRTMATVNETRGWMQQQWARQRKKLTSR